MDFLACQQIWRHREYFDGNSTHRFERKLASALRGMVLPLADFLAPLSERLYRTDRQVEDYNHVRLHRALA